MPDKTASAKAKTHRNGNGNGKSAVPEVQDVSQSDLRQKLLRLNDKKTFTRSERQRIRESFADVLSMMLTFHQLLEGADEVDTAVPKRKRKPAQTIAALCKEHLGDRKAQPLEVPAGPLEIDLLFHRLVESGVAKPLAGFSATVRLPEYVLDRYHYRATRFVQTGNNRMAFRQHSGVVVAEPGPAGNGTDDHALPPLMLLVGNGPAGSAIVVYHEAKTPDVTAAVDDWVRDVRRKHSAFRGQVIMADARGLSFIERPRSVAWDDIVPEAEVRDEFAACMHLLEHPDQYRERGIPVKRGVILAGPPGTGKTVHLECFVSAVRAANLPVFQISNTVHAASLREVYETAELAGPSLVVLEDIDTIASRRPDDVYDEHGYGSTDMLNTLLSVLDGSEQRDGVVTIATTNNPDAIDRALANRPGRFDRLFRFTYPPRERRLEVLALHAQLRELELDVEAALASAGGQADWLLDDDGVTPAHLAEAVDSVVRDLTRDPDVQPEASFLAAVAAMKDNISADRRFAQKKKDEVGFRYESY